MINLLSIFKQYKKIIFAFILSFAIPFFMFYIINFFIFDNVVFKDDLYICNINISGLSNEEIKTKLNNFIKSYDEELFIKLTYNNKIWSLTNKDFEVKSKVHTVISQIENYSKLKRFFNKKELINKIKAMGFDNKVATNFAFLGIEKRIDEIAKEIEVEPIPTKAKYNFDENKFKIIPEIAGSTLDKNSLYDDIVKSLNKTNKPTISLKTVPTYSSITKEDIILSTKFQSQFSTNYFSSNANRKNNIKMSVNKLREIEIQPNQEFSFNQIVGKRTLKNGFMEANIIKNGEFVKGLGGGVCQVSTTLYNALLLANIEVSESHKHSLPVSYVKPALDAMVSWGTHDLKFVNNTNLPIRIIGTADGKNITFKIFGNTNPQGYKLKTRGEIIKTIYPENDIVIADKDGIYSDKITYKGEFYTVKNSKNGYEAVSYLDYYLGDSLIKTKQLRQAKYDAQKGIKYEGTKDISEKPITNEQNFYFFDYKFTNTNL